MYSSCGVQCAMSTATPRSFEKQVGCIVPAAGLSERMGRWKPLLPYPPAGGKALVEVSVDRALETCDRVILVTGYRGEELERLFEGRRKVVCLRNGEYRRGMFSSIRTGAAEVEAPYFFVALADMPELPAKLYRLLLSEIGGPAALTRAAREDGPEMVRPVYGGKPGHPVLCRRAVADTILSEPPESNMQNVMRGHRVLEIEVQWPECLYDIDRPGDL